MSTEIEKDGWSNPVNTLYIGGGTPSVLPLSVFETILSSLKSAGCPGGFREFTVEVNPEDIVEKGHSFVEGLLGLGVNRISMGVQSFDDRILKWMNRRHDSEGAIRAYSILEECGVENISIDLIFGLPQLSSSGWEASLNKALNISHKGKMPEHISSYQLSVEPGSALEAMLKKGGWQEASEEVCAGQYESLCSILRDAGYNHYEISNFALPGHEAVHNSAYWNHVPYIGLGPGAHSFRFNKGMDKEYIRMWNNPDLRQYIMAAEIGDFSPVRDYEILTSDQVSMEKIMLALRTADGVDEQFLMEHGRPGKVASFLEEGKLQSRNGMISIPEEYFFISDNIITEIV